MQQADWDSLLRVIAMRAKLEKVSLMDGISQEERTAPATLVRAFLHAIQQNTAIRSVDVAVATSSHRYIYICGQCVFNHIIQT